VTAPLIGAMIDLLRGSASKSGCPSMPVATGSPVIGSFEAM
jgi:hypothetical protein